MVEGGAVVEEGGEVGAVGVVLGWVGRLEVVVGAVVGEVVRGDVVLGEVVGVVGWEEALRDGGAEVVGFVRLVVPDWVGAVEVAPGFGVPEVAPAGGSISVVGGRFGSLPLRRMTANVAAAIASTATTPAASALFRARSASNRLASARLTCASSAGSSAPVTGSSSAAGTAAAPIGVVAEAVIGGPIGTTPGSSPSDSARSAPAASSAAVGRSAGSLASIRNRTLSKGPASSGRCRLGSTAGASTCW